MRSGELGMFEKDVKHQSKVVRENFKFNLVPAGEDEFKIQLYGREQFLHVNHGDKFIGCSASSTSESTQIFSLAEGAKNIGWFVEGTFENEETPSRFLSAQYNDSPFNVDALISMETVEEMRELALTTGDLKS